ncbi:MAG: hypothetical protein ACDS79_16570 [Enterobacteriaceae bacterium]
MYKVLRTITDSFSLRELLRVSTPQNHLYYDLGAITKAITRPETVALMESGQLYGDYGHNVRERGLKATGSLRLPEYDEIKDPDGSIRRVKVIPACRTVSISLDDDVITHQQEILDTPAGRLVNALEESGAGGWSWACFGHAPAGRAMVRFFEGLDYVLQPNFLSLSRKAELPADMLSKASRATPEKAVKFSEHALILEDAGRTNTRIAMPTGYRFAPQKVRYFG